MSVQEDDEVLNEAADLVKQGKLTREQYYALWQKVQQRRSAGMSSGEYAFEIDINPNPCLCGGNKTPFGGCDDLDRHAAWAKATVYGTRPVQ